MKKQTPQTTFKRMTQIVLITTGVFLVLFFSLNAFLKWVNDPLPEVKSQFQLGKKETYIIKKTTKILSKKTIIYYILCKTHESNCLSNPADYTSTYGRTLSNNNSIEISPYLDKPVYVYGEFYSDGWPALRIDHLELVEQ